MGIWGADGWYVNEHESQYGAGRSARTRSSGCTWTAGCNGIDAATAGRIDPEPDLLLSKLARSEETNPTTPGWSLDDLRRASGRMGVQLLDATGTGWLNVVAKHELGYYIVLQGDSDRFGDGSCSGVFDGDHAVGIHPITVNGRWLIDDPICPTARYETPATLRAYATKLYASVRFGYYIPPVPRQEDDDMIDLYGVIGRQSARFRAGASLYDRPGGKVVATVNATAWYELAGKDRVNDPSWYLVDHGGTSPMRYAREADIVARQTVPATTGSVTVTIGPDTYTGTVKR